VFHLQPYGLIVLSGLVVGGVAMSRAARRLQLPVGEMIGLAGVLVMASLIGSHLLDVIAYQLDRAHADPSLWFQLFNGVSLFGAFAAIAIVAVIWSSARGLPLGKVADCIVLGLVVALVIGRIGCAYVHDHPGTPTSLPFGINLTGTVWTHDTPYGSEPLTIRVHDLGLEELLCLIPIAAALWLLAIRRRRPGMLAVIFGLAYAPIRFGLDFLRASCTEPTHPGLTTGQWGCIVMLLLAIAGLTNAPPPTDERGASLASP
jgi:phosphatidylglycerol:prolipoprotein diacylglycerol transferase